MSDIFDIAGKVAVLTGAGGVLGGGMAEYLGAQGAKIAVVDLAEEMAEAKAESIRAAGGEAVGIAGNVLQRDSIEQATDDVLKKWGRIDILINAAGGNKKEATASKDLSFFDIPEDAMRFVVDLNLLGTVLPSQVVGRQMVSQSAGVIVNISSMNSFRPLTRIVGYSVAKAAVNNFTQWLAVHLAQEYSPEIRVNAIAPGFFETAQNRFLLRDESGTLSARGEQIIAHTPANRFGAPNDLYGTLHWLVSPASGFVSGIVVPVDGGFSAFSGV
jgi:NAD(P)-dependent dehydrogenase (short-subunit alcohol dehydrogenase family)